MEVPAPLILHFESPSPFTPLGSKGVGEGNCMSTPVCIANAVADALGVAEIDLPLTPAKLARWCRGGMKPAPFDYVRAETLAEAHDVLAAEGGDARVIAGGQTLVPLLSMRMARPKVVLDIMHVAGTRRHIASRDDAIRVGAAVRQAELLAWPDLPRASRCSPQALPWVGHAQTRAAARSAARSRCRSERGTAAVPCRRSAARLTLSSQAAAPQRDGGRFLHRPDVDRAQPTTN